MVMERVEKAKVKLVCIVAPDRLGDAIASELRSNGASGFTAGRAEGWGKHGSSSFGLLQAGNIRIEALVSPEVAETLLSRVVKRFAGEAVIAYMHDAEAVPRSHFD